MTDPKKECWYKLYEVLPPNVPRKFTIRQFAEKERLEMVVIERPETRGAMRYYAKFDAVDVSLGGLLVGTFGNGATPDEAIADYAKEISGKTIVDVGYGNPRREIKVPELIPE